MKKISKTNAMRILDKQKIEYEVFGYDVSDKMIDGKSVCSKLGINTDEMFKTLVFHTKQNRILVYVIPVCSELDLKKAAEVVGEKKIEMLALSLLLPTTGYEKGGCSPIGMKKNFEVFVSDTCENLNYMYLNGGKVGVCIKMKSCDFLHLVAKQSVNVITE